MAVLAHGAIVKMGDGGGTEIFTAISGPLDIEFDPGENERVDVTNHDSLAREYLNGLAGEGEMSFDVQYDQSVSIHKEVRDKKDEEQTTNFQLLFKDGTLVDLAATVVIKFTLAVASAAQIMSVTLRVSGQPVFTDP